MPEHLQAPILDAVKKAAQRAKAAQDERDQLIKDAVDSGQVNATELAKAAGVSRQRVYQIRDGK